MTIQTRCASCTVPTEGAELCGFCATYVPPGPEPTAPQRIDDYVNKIDMLRADINAVIRTLPDDTPMFVIVDITNALWNLRNASVLLDKASDTLEADAEAVN